jgi:hypothetical protein
MCNILHHFSGKLTIGVTCIAGHLFIRHQLFCLKGELLCLEE